MAEREKKRVSSKTADREPNMWLIIRVKLIIGIVLVLFCATQIYFI